MNNSLYFKDKLESNELKNICKNMTYRSTITLEDCIESDLYYTHSTTNIVLVIPLFYCESISSDNAKDVCKNSSVTCEYKKDTILRFNGGAV